MSEAIRRFLGAVSTAEPFAPVELPQPAQLPVRSINAITTAINADWAEFETALATAVERMIRIGAALNEAKAQVGHRHFGNYVTSNFRFSPRWAQQCMKFANNKATLLQELERLRSIGSYLAVKEAQRIIGALNARPKPKLKPKT
jgi:hypothetical protein